MGDLAGRPGAGDILVHTVTGQGDTPETGLPEHEVASAAAGEPDIGDEHIEIQVPGALGFATEAAVETVNLRGGAMRERARVGA
jgi:hypothetical protein